MDSKKLQNIMNKINYKFKNEELLLEALTHRSYHNEHLQHKFNDNERLEFLGDSVMDLITTEYIFELYKDYNEGELSKIKSQIISEAVFSSIAEDIGLGEYLFLSNGEITSGGRYRKSTLGDAFEALIGAVFQDSDFYQAKIVALSFLKNKISNLDKIEGVSDFKTDLQEYVQSHYKSIPKYEVISSEGPDHNKTFNIGVYINGKLLAKGEENSKKAAEKKAAEKALKILKE